MEKPSSEKLGEKDDVLPSEEDCYKYRRFTISTVREYHKPLDRNLVDTGVTNKLKPALKASPKKGGLTVVTNMATGKKQTTFSPTLTLISESEDYSKPIVRTASLGTSPSTVADGVVDYKEVARIVRRRLSIIREQQDNIQQQTKSPETTESDKPITHAKQQNNNANELPRHRITDSPSDGFLRPGRPF